VIQTKKAIGNLLRAQSFDLVIFSGREVCRALEKLNVPIVIDCGDANCTRLLQQMKYATTKQKVGFLLRYFNMRHEEKRLCRVTRFHSFISERDRKNLCGPSDQSAIVPQGVDCDYWKRSSQPATRPCIVFHGVMSYPPNADASLFLLKKILPRVRQAVPELEVFIVGRDPQPELLSAARQYHDITVTGAVDDIRPYLERAMVYVAALRFASGVQNKVLEAMAMEVPVVTTPVVSAGLSMDGTQPLLVIGQTEEEIADGIVKMLTHAEERARFSAEGRRFVEAHCSWSHSADILEELCLEAIGRSRPIRQGQGAAD
jgi:glycosyltransferase involved in cell wall biosynthesis